MLPIPYSTLCCCCCISNSPWCKNLDEHGIGADLFFGGGEYDHNKVAQGIDRDRDGQTTTHRIVMDPQLDDVLFNDVFPQPLIGGEKLYSKYTFEDDGETIEIVGWTGITLSSFGIVYNRDTLKQLGIDEPETWSDLGDPRLRGWVALADPGHSGSISATFETILNREGWTQGWITLRNAFANERNLQQPLELLRRHLTVHAGLKLCLLLA